MRSSSPSGGACAEASLSAALLSKRSITWSAFTAIASSLTEPSPTLVVREGICAYRSCLLDVLAPSSAACRSEETERVRSGEAERLGACDGCGKRGFASRVGAREGGRTAGDPSAPSRNRVGTDRASCAVATSASSANAVPRIANTRRRARATLSDASVVTSPLQCLEKTDFRAMYICKQSQINEKKAIYIYTQFED